MKTETLEEINRRQQLIISEPNGIVRETMIANLLIDIEERSYSEEEVLVILHKRDMYEWEEENEILSVTDWFEQFKKK